MINSSREILANAYGHWPSILENLGINASYLKDKHGPCPVCDGKDRFRFDNKNGRGTFFCNRCGAGDAVKLLQIYHGWNFPEVIKQISIILGISSLNLTHSGKPLVRKIKKQTVQNDIEEAEKRRQKLTLTWRTARQVVVDDPVDRYLKARGIALEKYPDVLRYHPNLSYYSDDKKLIGCFPAMLALVTNEKNKGVTLHRTYLGNGCKANVPKPKKLMSAIRPRASVGAAIKLDIPVDGKIALAEGIETAFSINIAAKIAAWATGSAYGLENIILPPSITEVIIAVDNDESNRGQEAASILAARLLKEGRIVRRIIPQKVGQDFNDLLLEGDL